MSKFVRKLREKRAKAKSQNSGMQIQYHDQSDVYSDASPEQQQYYQQLQSRAGNTNSIPRAMTTRVEQKNTHVSNVRGPNVMVTSEGPKFGQSSKTMENKFGQLARAKTTSANVSPGYGTQSSIKTLAAGGPGLQPVGSSNTIHSKPKGTVRQEVPQPLKAPVNQVSSTTVVNKDVHIPAARTLRGENAPNPMAPLGARDGAPNAQIQWNRMARTDLNFGVLLNVFNRKPLFGGQLRQIAQSTVRPKFLMVNAYGQDLEELGLLEQFDVRVLVSQSSENLGAWLRFHQAYELLSDVDFVLVLDDDTFPGIAWVEGAIEFARNQDFPVVVATSGMVFDTDPEGAVVTGREATGNVAERVTFGTGGWLIPASVLETFVGAIGRFPGPWGWQIHLDFAAQAAGGGTYVLNMPGNQNAWGSIREPVRDEASISVVFGDGFTVIQDEAIAFYEALGWKGARIMESSEEETPAVEEQPVIHPEVVEE